VIRGPFILRDVVDVTELREELEELVGIFRGRGGVEVIMSRIGIGIRTKGEKMRLIRDCYGGRSKVQSGEQRHCR
jgi:hypothetical protein